MKRLLFISAFILAGLAARAQVPSFRYGVEWGYTANIYEYHRYVFLTQSEPHYLAPVDRHSGLSYSTNAYILGVVGFDFLKKSNISLLSGYMGLYKHRRSVPLCLRYSFHFAGNEVDGFHADATAGVGFTDNGAGLCRTAALGGGYSLSLDKDFRLALTLSLRGTFDNPPVWDELDNTYIDKEYVRRNDATYVSINLGLALSF